jgi:hypothetical protein
MTKEQFTAKMKSWLDKPKEQRDLEEGALLLLQLTNNKIMYRNISRNIASHADYIEFMLKRYLSYRLQSITHEEVRQMQTRVDLIATEHNLQSTARQSGDKSPSSEFRAGKRADHDTLPSENQALYVENASIMQRMRELHLKLRTLSGAEATCPDSDRYSFLKEIIALDKQYHANWKAYDEYQVQNAPDSSATSPVANVPSAAFDSRMEQKNILRQINLNKGRYKKSPTEALKEKLASLYSQLASPTDKLTAELKELGVIS